MDFFDKLSKKASDTYKATKEKTSQISGELKLRGKINEIKDKIGKSYSQLGKMTYNNRTNGEITSEEEIQNVCDTISQNMKEIQNLEADILKLKNIRKCEKCSAEIDVNAVFCPKCGAEQPKNVHVEIKEEPNDATEVEAIEVVQESAENNDTTTEEADIENNTTIETDSENKTEDNKIE